MKKILIIILLNAMLMAQAVPFEEFLVGFWPEYDHPGVLVTIEMITPEDQLPLDFNMFLPVEANMALRSTDNAMGEKELVHQQINSEAGFNVMPIHVDQREFYIQFYYNPFGTDKKREFSFDLRVDIDVSHYHVIIQELVGSEDFKTSLGEAEVIRDDFGFTYYRQHLDNLRANMPFNINFSYTNILGKTSVDAMRDIMDDHAEFPGNNQGMGQGNTNVQTRTGGKGFLYFLMILVPAILIAVVYLGKKSSISTEPQADKMAKQRSSKFCTNCGTRVEGSPKFCTSCGKEINVS